MAAKNNEQKSEGKTGNESQPLINVAVNTSFKRDTFSRMTSAKKAKGFLTHQELVRAAVSYYLEKTGF